MTTSAEISPAVSLDRAWLRRVGEFLVVGGITPFLFPLAWLLRKAVGLDSATFAAGFTTFYAAHVINDPHFAVTYVLFYRGARGRLRDSLPPMQRLRYWVAGVVVPIVLAAWGFGAILRKSAFEMGLMIQLMFFLVGWHYVKQGFGVMTVLSARRGVRFSSRERLAILAHCLAGWAYAWAEPFDPGRQVEEKGVVYMTIAHGLWLERVTHIVFLLTIVPLAAVLVQKWRREGPLPLFTPLTALLCTVWAWTIYSSIDPVVVYVIPALHSIQYLYFVWLLRAPEAKEREGPPSFEVSAKIRLGTLAITAVGLGWLFFHGAPTYFDDLFVSKRAAFDSPLGPTPYFAAIYTFVNLHHFAMDAVIWRKDNPETRYLQKAS